MMHFCCCGSTILKKDHLLVKHWHTAKHQKYLRENPEEN